MTAHLRANLWLLALTVLLCCVLYPLALLGIGQVAFHDKAQGSLLDATGRPAADAAHAVGSRIDRPALYGRRIFSAAALGGLV